ncbi:MAG: GntR family transcriptional regulator [Lachnospiraceae bacterium]|jgi:GntR family transcriptional regulator of arabinose operon|nr:GntR family transcriptional regulator [Lachnospiraceae bacterium]
MGEKGPKYLEIVNWIKDKIKSGEYKSGFRVTSENELAAMFKMSRQTVRRALSVLEKEGIIESRRGSGTYIANLYEENVRTPEVVKPRSTKNIAVLTTYVDEYIFTPMIKEIENTLSSHGFNMQLSFSHNSVDKERTVLKHLLREDNIDGLICETTKSGLPSMNLDLYLQMIDKNIPIMFLNTFYPELVLPHVSMDDRESAYIVTEYLIQNGHKDIAAIFKFDDGQGLRRYEGYCKALKKYGIEIENERIAWVDTKDINPLKAYGKRIMDRVKDCTAVVCYNDAVAEQFLKLCAKSGINCPEDISIVGIDNSDDSANFNPPLTTANNPIINVSHLAVENLIRLIKGEQFNATYEFKPELVVRKSVKCIN